MTSSVNFDARPVLQHFIIADVANSKRHQRLDEILIIFTLTIQEISKVVCKKTMSETRAFLISLCCMKCVHYSKLMLRKQDCVVSRAYCMTEIFENNFVDFSDVVRVKKKSRIRPAVGSVSN